MPPLTEQAAEGQTIPSATPTTVGTTPTKPLLSVEQRKEYEAAKARAESVIGTIPATLEEIDRMEVILVRGDEAEMREPVRVYALELLNILFGTYGTPNVQLGEMSFTNNQWHLDFTIGQNPDGSPPRYDLFGASNTLSQHNNCATYERLAGDHHFTLTIDVQKLMKYQGLRRMTTEGIRQFNVDLRKRLEEVLRE